LNNLNGLDVTLNCYKRQEYKVQSDHVAQDLQLRTYVHRACSTDRIEKTFHYVNWDLNTLAHRENIGPTLLF
jgi:hypothetical protein